MTYKVDIDFTGLRLIASEWDQSKVDQEMYEIYIYIYIYL